MSDWRMATPPVSKPPIVGTDECPRVADLIDYALGQIGAEEHQRIEAHLRNGSCVQCRGWVEKAARFRTEPWLDATAKSFAAPAIHGFSNSSPPSADGTPIPSNTKWHRQALRELEKRLRILEENQ